MDWILVPGGNGLSAVVHFITSLFVMVTIVVGKFAEFDTFSKRWGRTHALYKNAYEESMK